MKAFMTFVLVSLFSLLLSKSAHAAQVDPWDFALPEMPVPPDSEEADSPPGAEDEDPKVYIRRRLDFDPVNNWTEILISP